MRVVSLTPTSHHLPTPLSGIFLTFGGRQSLHDLQHLSSLIVFYEFKEWSVITSISNLPSKPEQTSHFFFSKRLFCTGFLGEKERTTKQPPPPGFAVKSPSLLKGILLSLRKSMYPEFQFSHYRDLLQESLPPATGRTLMGFGAWDFRKEIKGWWMLKIRRQWAAEKFPWNLLSSSAW